MNRPSCYSDLCWRSCWPVMQLYYLCSKWTRHAVRWSSTPVPPVCCRPSTRHDCQQPRDPRRREPGQTAKLELDLYFFFFFSFLNVFPLFLPQVDDADSQCSISGVTVDSTETEGMIADTVDSEDLLLVTDTPPPHSEDFHPPSAPCTPLLSPADRALARLNRSAFSEPNSQRGSPPLDGCDLRYDQISVFCFQKSAGCLRAKLCVLLFSSPTLVALEMDSEEETSETKSPISLFLSDGQCEDRLEPCHPSPDLTFPPGRSAVSAHETSAKVNAASAFHQTPRLASQDLILWFPTSRKQLTQGLGCVPIPTRPPKSVCVPLG